MKLIVIVICLLICSQAYASYVIRFEGENHVASVKAQGSLDEQNKIKQADKWKKGNPSRAVVLSDNSSPWIKLKSGKIKSMTQQEIDDQLESQKPITEVEKLLDLLDNQEVINKIKSL